MTNEELFKNGDFEELYKQNIKFIYKQIKPYRNIELDERISLANLAFAKALKFYDVTKGIKFISYFGNAIRNEMWHYISKNKSNYELFSLDYEYQQRNGEAKKLEDLIESNFDLDDKINGSILVQKLYETINKLPDNQKEVTLSRLNGLTYKEIEANMHYSHQWLCVLRNKANKKIKYALKKEMKVVV